MNDDKNRTPGDPNHEPSLEQAIKAARKKDKDPDERALGSDDGHRSEAPDYPQLLREDDTERRD
jgi:hypothetical protein